MSRRSLGIIGGSGLYDLDSLKDTEEVRVSTPFGDPSAPLLKGTLHGVDVAFLPRHGRGHTLAPHELPFRANIHAMKQLGMQCVLGISAVGSLREEIAPGDLVLIDQFIDRTKGRTEESTFFGRGCVGHAHFADPIWEPLRQVALQAARSTGATIHDGGTYVCMEGPAFSTRAESHLYRSFGAAVIGMTNLQEAKLAREAEIAYATVALATDYDCWHESEEDVSVKEVLAVLRANVEKSKQVIEATARLLAETTEDIHCEGVMEHAVITHRDSITQEARRRLEVLIGRYLG